MAKNTVADSAQAVNGNEFWSRVRMVPGGCWEYTGNRGRNGYGHVKINRRSALAHRIAWALVNGPIPDGLCVLHRCDNRPCCNPDHLFLGTLVDNNADRHAKGRSRGGSLKGNDNGSAKLNARDVAEIRKRRGNGMRQSHIAELFGISQSQVSDIVNRKQWTHVN